MKFLYFRSKLFNKHVMCSQKKQLSSHTNVGRPRYYAICTQNQGQTQLLRYYEIILSFFTFFSCEIVLFYGLYRLMMVISPVRAPPLSNVIPVK